MGLGEEDVADAVPGSRSRERAATHWGAGLALAVFLLATGLGRGYFEILRPVLDVSRASGWRPAPVLSSTARVLPFHGMVHVDFEYRYSYDGREYRGSRYAFRHPSLYLDDDALFALQDGLPATCFVNPEDPRASVLSRELPLGAYRPGGLLITLFGGLILAWSLWFRRAAGQSWAEWPSRVPTLLTRAAAVLAGAWGIYVPAVSGLSVPKAVFLLLSLAFAAGLWVSDPRVLRRVATGLLVLAGLLSLCGLNPLGLMDVTTDEVHDPGYVASYFLGWFSRAGVLTSVAYMAAVPRAVGCGTNGHPMREFRHGIGDWRGSSSGRSEGST